MLYVFGSFRLDTQERRLLYAGKPVPLARKTFDLLQSWLPLQGDCKHAKS